MIIILENIDFKINEKTQILIKFNSKKCHKAMQRKRYIERKYLKSIKTYNNINNKQEQLMTISVTLSTRLMTNCISYRINKVRIQQQ